MPDNREVLNLSEAAEYLRVSTKTLREMARAGKVPAQKAGREWRFLAQALKEWLAVPAGGEKGNRADAASKPGVREPYVQYEISFAGFKDTAFKDNFDRAMHRWVPWIAGFSGAFVRSVLESVQGEAEGAPTVLDPFAGVGTTLVEAMKLRCEGIGFEINPYAALASRVKVGVLDYDLNRLRRATAEYGSFIERALSGSASPRSRPPAHFRTRTPFFSPSVQRKVLFSRDYISELDPDWCRDIFRLALGAVMVGFSNYSYEPSLGTRVAAGKPEVEDADVPSILQAKLIEILEDIEQFQADVDRERNGHSCSLVEGSFFENSRRLAEGSVDVVVTSPPYLNNYHYIRNTRPQMFWLDMVARPADLKTMEQDSFGQFWQTVRSGPTVELAVDLPPLQRLLGRLRKTNPDKGAYGGQGWANYAASYFNDCARLCLELERLVRPGGRAVVVIGNNILQGIEFKTDEFFAQIAEQRGFEVVEMHEVRTKRIGTSIVNSSVRRGTVKKRTKLYETAVELRRRG